MVDLHVPAAAVQWRQSVIQVGAGRGFVLVHGDRRFVATAAHCLPFLPPATGASLAEERTRGAKKIDQPTIRSFEHERLKEKLQADNCSCHVRAFQSCES